MKLPYTPSDARCHSEVRGFVDGGFELLCVSLERSWETYGLELSNLWSLVFPYGLELSNFETFPCA